MPETLGGQRCSGPARGERLPALSFDHLGKAETGAPLPAGAGGATIISVLMSKDLVA